MATALRSTLEQLVRDFANHVLAALRTASLSDLATETGRGAPVARATSPASGGGGGRAPRLKGRIKLQRRSADAIERVVSRVVALLQSNPGMRAEQIRGRLNLAQNELAGPIQRALAEGKISKQGIKRATKYFAGKKAGGGAPAGGAKKDARRGPRRGKKK